MNTKGKLNCYFFSNLIACFLSLNSFVNNKNTDLILTKNENDNTLVNVFEVQEVANSIAIEDNNYFENEDNTVMEISVATKNTASKKVINYVKPSYNSVTGANLVNYAKNYLGLAYVYAGESLSTGTDCSGFTRLIFREFGINLGKTVGSQLYSGTYVSRDDLQPGDLVFYGYSAGHASHVAIYMGNGLIIHQSTPRNGVKIDTVNIMVYITARRLITSNVVKLEEPKEEVKEDLKSNEQVDKENNAKVEEKDKNNKNETLEDKNLTSDKKDLNTNDKVSENKDEVLSQTTDEKVDSKKDENSNQVTNSEVNHNINNEEKNSNNNSSLEKTDIKEETSSQNKVVEENKANETVTSSNAESLKEKTVVVSEEVSN